jgi:hypothetical protein
MLRRAVAGAQRFLRGCADACDLALDLLGREGRGEELAGEPEPVILGDAARLTPEAAAMVAGPAPAPPPPGPPPPLPGSVEARRRGAGGEA